MNLQETNILRKLDETVESIGEGIIGTQYGNITVRKVANNTYYAVLHATSMELIFANGTASNAFLKLADKIKANTKRKQNGK